MTTTQAHYATKRCRRGADRWHPTGYGPEPSTDGTENLRFGRVTIRYDQTPTARRLDNHRSLGVGNGPMVPPRTRSDGGSSQCIPLPFRTPRLASVLHFWPLRIAR